MFCFSPRTCPEDGEEINERHVKTDKGCSKEIKSLAAVCGGSINGCTWRGNIDETEVSEPAWCDPGGLLT